MRAVLALAAVAVLAASACSSNDPNPEPVPVTSPTTPATSSDTSSSSTPTPTVSSEPAPPPPPAAPADQDPAPAPALAAPVFVRCYLADGTALMSDGTTTYMDSCNESAGGPYLLEDGRSIYDLQPTTYYEPPPSQTYPGWTCDGPAYLCRDDAASGKTEGQ